MFKIFQNVQNFSKCSKFFEMFKIFRNVQNFFVFAENFIFGELRFLSNFSIFFEFFYLFQNVGISGKKTNHKKFKKYEQFETCQENLLSDV